MSCLGVSLLYLGGGQMSRTKHTAVCTEVADRGCLCLGLWILKDGIQGQDETAALLSQALACSYSLTPIGGIVGERYENTESTEDPRRVGGHL